VAAFPVFTDNHVRQPIVEALLHVTGLGAGFLAGAHEVDRGVTSILSPAIELPSSGTLTLGFAYYFAHQKSSSSADFFRVTIVGSATAGQVFQELGAATTLPAAYNALTAAAMRSRVARVVRPGGLQLSLQDPDFPHQRQRASSPRLLQKAPVKALLREALDLGEDR
jgi:hypothetical protein